MLRKTLFSCSLAAAAAFPAFAFGEDAKPVTGNVGVFSDYRFRGLTQTMLQPALQGGFDYAHASGFYLGTWNSNVSSAVYTNANLEMDLYGGYKGSFKGDWSYDVGVLQYVYPGSSMTMTNPQTGRTCVACKTDNTEIYGALSWKWLSLKYSIAVSDFFGNPDTKNSTYLDASATYDLGGGWGVNGHYGKQTVKNLDAGNYSDYKLGITRDVAGYVFGLSYIGTNAKGDPGQFYNYADAKHPSGINIGKAGAVLSLSKSF